MGEKAQGLQPSLVFPVGHQAGPTVEYHGASHEGASLLQKIQKVTLRSAWVLICSSSNFNIQNSYFKPNLSCCNIRSSCSWNKKHSCSLSPIKYCFINLKTVINYISAFWLQANIHNSFSVLSQSASNLLIIFPALLPSSAEGEKAL